MVQHYILLANWVEAVVAIPLGCPKVLLRPPGLIPDLNTKHLKLDLFSSALLRPTAS